MSNQNNHPSIKLVVLGNWFLRIGLLVCLPTFFVSRLSADDGSSANARRPGNDEALEAWLQNMVWHHGFTKAEITAATGLGAEVVDQKLRQFKISPATKPKRKSKELLVLPYPGGRHPRIGFLDGAIDPQRETKVSVFAPWDETSYVVLDVPEAIWSNLGLTYLAHTHIPTIFDKQKKKLKQLEWTRKADGSLACQRKLPNGIEFGTIVRSTQHAVLMEMWLKNGTDQTLTGLRVQNCAMLKGARGFEKQTNENKVFWKSYAACQSNSGNRWVIHSWTHISRLWGNENCPCLHADPKFPDCKPGETQTIKGWFSFFEGNEIQSEFERIELLNWKKSGED